MFKFEVENGCKYYMASRYEFYPDVDGNRVDYVHIGVATEKDFENDGFNYVDRRESVDFEICDTIKDAILRSGKIADRVEFVDLPEEDMEEAKKVVDELMHDAEYLKEFGLRLEGLVVSVYNQKTKEVVECIMNDEKDENRIRLGDIVEFKTSCGKETIVSGVVVDMEEKKIGREVCYWYLFKNETGNGFYIRTNEKKVETVVEEPADIETEEDIETVPFI